MGCTQSFDNNNKSGAAEIRRRPPQEEEEERMVTVANVQAVPKHKLGRGLSRFEKVVVVRVEWVQLGDTGGVALSRGLRGLAALRAVRVAWCGLGPKTGGALARLFGNSEVLSLDVQGNAFRAEFVSRLARAIADRGDWGPLGSRVELRMSDNPLVGVPGHGSVARLADLAEALRAVPRRKRLALAAVGLKFVGPARRLVTALAAGRFDIIDLASNELDEFAAENLADALVEHRAGDGDEAVLPDARCIKVYEAALRLDETHPLSAREPGFAAVDRVFLVDPVPLDAAADALRVDADDLASCRGVHAKGGINPAAWRLYFARVGDAVAGRVLARLDLRFNPCEGSALRAAWPRLCRAVDANAAKLSATPPHQLLLVDDTPHVVAGGASFRKRKKKKRVVVRHSRYWLLLRTTDEATENALRSLVGAATIPGMTFDLERLAEPRTFLLAVSGHFPRLEDHLLASDLLRGVDALEPAAAASLPRWNPVHLPPPDVVVVVEEPAKKMVERASPTSVEVAADPLPSREATTRHDNNDNSATEEPRWSRREDDSLAEPRVATSQNKNESEVVEPPTTTEEDDSQPVAERDRRFAEGKEAPGWQHKDDYHEEEAKLSAASLRVARLLAKFEDDGGDLGDAFRSFDATGDGELSVAELHRGLLGLGEPFDQLSRRDVERIVADADATHLTMDDLASLVMRGRAALRREPLELSPASLKVCELLTVFVEAKGRSLRDAFQFFDTSSDGAVSLEELHAGLGALGPPFDQLDRADIRAVFDDIGGGSFQQQHQQQRDGVTLEALGSFLVRGQAALSTIPSHL